LPSSRVPPNHRALIANLALNPGLEIDVHQVAFGDRAGSLTLSSDRPGVTSGSYSAVNPGSGGFVVRQQTVDEWAVDRDLSRLRLVKLDVEGWEALVLDGASQTILTLRPHLMLEWNHGHNATDELAGRIRQLITDLGYEGFLIDRSRIAGKGVLVPVPPLTSDWPDLCNLLLVPAKS